VLKNELDTVSTGLTRQLNLTNFDLGILSSSTKKLKKIGSVVNELSAFATRCKQCIDHHAAHVARQMSMMHHDLRRDQDRVVCDINAAMKDLGKRNELHLEELERRNVERLNAMERRMEERVQAVERRLEEDSKAQLQEMEQDSERRLQ
jgi:flavoprotein